MQIKQNSISLNNTHKSSSTPVEVINLGSDSEPECQSRERSKLLQKNTQVNLINTQKNAEKTALEKKKTPGKLVENASTKEIPASITKDSLRSKKYTRRNIGRPKKSSNAADEVFTFISIYNSYSLIDIQIKIRFYRCHVLNVIFAVKNLKNNTCYEDIYLLMPERNLTVVQNVLHHSIYQ